MSTFISKKFKESAKLILILGPSGSGKSTALSYLRQERPNFVYPKSLTTRKAREGLDESDIYNFVTKEEFEKKISNGDVLEYALIHNQYYYGTSKSDIMNALNDGKVVVREVDYQGFVSISKLLSKDVLKSVFILPPSNEVMIERIKSRADISEEDLQNRLNSMKKELLYADGCTIQIPSVFNSDTNIFCSKFLDVIDFLIINN